MSGLKFNSGKSTSIGHATPVDRTNLNPSLYEGMMVYDVNKQLYFSNGSIWVLVQPANVQFSFTGNNALFMNGRQQSQLSVNSAVYSTNAIFSYTANNSTFAYGKQEGQLSVNAATFAINSVSASLAITANNSTFAYGKQEAQLAVATAVLANNTTFAYGKQEGQLSVNLAVLANNSSFAYGKQEAQLSVNLANNSNYLEGRNWASPSDIGGTNASNGTFTNVRVLNNLTVNGTMTVVNTTITTTNNTFFILNDGQTTPFNDAGFVFQRYASPSASNYNVAFFWDEASKSVILGKADGTITSNTQNLNITAQLLSASEDGIITVNGQLNANAASVNRLTVDTVIASGSSGNTGQYLTANGTGGTYWYTFVPSLPIANDNTSSVKYYLPMSNGVSGSWTNAVISDARLSFIPSTGTLTANQGAFTNALISGDAYISRLIANGQVGGTGQVLLSNGAGIYWENSLTIAPGAGYGLGSNGTHYQVNANSGIIANNTGTFVNAAYIATISSNNTSFMNGKQESQLSVNSSVFATNATFAYTANLANYANFAFIANNSIYLDGRTWESPSVIGAVLANSAYFSNTIVNVAQIGVLNANGSSGTFGQILASNGTGLYWTSSPPGIAIPLTQNNNSTSTWYFPMSNSASGSWSNAAVADGKLSFVPTTGTLTVTVANTSKAIIANAVITAIFANGSFGGINQVLTSNGSAIYWTGDTNTMYDLIGVSNTVQNAGILRLVSSSNANDDVLFVGGGTTIVSSNGTHIVISTVDQFKGTVTSITSGNGLVGSPITTSGVLAIGSGAGISVNADDVAVNAKAGLTANASGLWVNNDFIRALSQVSVVNNAIYLNGKSEGELNANSALYANNSNYLGGKDADYWTTVALGNTSADYAWTGTHSHYRSMFMANTVSSYIEWNDAGLAAPSATASWGAGTKLALWQKFGPSDVGFGIGIEPGAIWYSANNTSSSHKWYANTNNIMVANTSGLYVNGQIFATVTQIVTSANNSSFAYGKQESQLSVASANNSTYAYGKQESQLSVASTNNTSFAYGKQESQLTVAVAANATFATTAEFVLGSIETANNATYAYGRQQGQLNVNNAVYAYGKQESQLNVANAVFATTAEFVLGSIETANNATHAYGKQESQLNVANAVFATTAQNVLGTSEGANNSTYAYGKQEFQLAVASATSATTSANAGFSTTANNALRFNGKQESQLSVSFAQNANNVAHLNGKQESQLSVSVANNSTYAYGKQETQLDAGFLNGQSGTYYADIPARLGYTPVQQGGGTSQLANKLYMGWDGSGLRLQIDSTDFGASWPISVTGSAGSATTAGSATSATSATLAAKASTLANAGGNGDAMTFNWSGQAGQPTWVWGGNDVSNMYVYNPSNFSVNYATSAGTVTTITSGQVTDALGYTPYNSTNPNGYISSVPNASTQVSSLGVGAAASGTAGAINATGNVTAADFIISSDARYKNVFGNISNALTAVNSLNGVTYTYNELSGKDTEIVRAGVIAQEVESVLPQAVYTDPDGYKSVSYDSIVPLLIEAIKELTARVEELESK